MPINVTREREALVWYERRHGEFMSAITLAHDQSEDEQLLALVEPFAPFFARRSYWDEGEQVLSWAVEAAARVGQPHTRAVMLNELGNRRGDEHKRATRFNSLIWPLVTLSLMVSNT
jgi:hypothetical protein